MSFNTALAGLQAATIDLGITSNNISNVSTTGFKNSRAEFADIFQVTPFGNTPTAIGSGVRVSSVSQQFDQGNLEFTEGSLDMAITGQGFFIMTENANDNDFSYTRAGQFRVDSEGFVTNNGGQFLRGFPVDTQGTVTSTSLNSTIPIQLPATTGAPQATTEVEIGVNLDSTATELDPANFDPTVSASYAHSTSTTVFDSLGASHVVSYYFVPDVQGSATNAANDPNQWAVFSYVDGIEADMTGGTTVAHTNNGVAVNQDAGFLNFNADGTLASSTPATLTNTINLTNGAVPLTVSYDFANNSTTQYSSDFTVNTLDSDGFPTGRLTGLIISDTGSLEATFSNGVSQPIASIALADFPNSQGLKNIGGAAWTETLDSGGVIPGAAGTRRFGLIQSGALETSNVDLTAELVNLITAQRNFQANARSIETSNTITETIIQIR